MSHDQASRVRTTRADTIATTAACCGRSVAELQAGRRRFGWESKPTGLASALRKKWWLLSHSLVHRAGAYLSMAVKQLSWQLSMAVNGCQ